MSLLNVAVQRCLQETQGNTTLACQRLCQMAENDSRLYQALTRPFLESAALLAVQKRAHSTSGIEKASTVSKSAVPSPTLAIDGAAETVLEESVWQNMLEQLADGRPASPAQQAETLRQMAKAFMARRYEDYQAQRGGLS